MNIEDILRHKQARLISINMEDTVGHAIRLLHRENVGAVIVQDVCHSEGNTVMGMFSERDVVRLLAEFGVAVLDKRVAEFMTQNVITCAPRDSVDHALGLMAKHYLRHLPVLDEFTLIGVVSMRDFLVHLGFVNGAAAHGHGVDAGH